MLISLSPINFLKPYNGQNSFSIHFTFFFITCWHLLNWYVFKIHTNTKPFKIKSPDLPTLQTMPFIRVQQLCLISLLNCGISLYARKTSCMILTLHIHVWSSSPPSMSPPGCFQRLVNPLLDMTSHRPDQQSQMRTTWEPASLCLVCGIL